jgi:cation:H+ antiporter
LLISGIQSPRAGLKRDFPIALVVPIVTGLLFLDGVLSRTEGAVLLAMFTAWLIATILDARRQRSAEAILGAASPWRAVLASVVGLALLISAGYSIVSGARGIAHTFGIGEFVIGATVVAVGTSVPELATSIIAKLRGHDEVGLGTIVGSNIFNGAFIVPVAALIHPIAVSRESVFVVLGFGTVALLCSYPDRGGFIERRRGILLLILYGAYLTSVLLRGETG